MTNINMQIALLEDHINANQAGELEMDMFDHVVEGSAFINEVTLAESLAPSIFVEMFFNHFESDRPLAEKQVLAAAMFRTIYRLGEGSCDFTILYDNIYDNLEYMCARNRDQVKGLRGSDFDIKAIAAFIGKVLKAMENKDGVITLTKEWLDKMYKRTSFTPMIWELAERRVPYQKKRSTVSKLGVESMDFKMNTQFTIDQQMINIINEAMLIEPKYEGWKKGALALNGSMMMSEHEIYVAEWSQDTNGREYCVPHYGPNPQGGDMDRALFKLAVGSTIYKGDKIFLKLMMEFKDIVKKESLLRDEVLIQCYEEPLKALIKAIRANVKNPLQFVRLGKDLGAIIKNGHATSYFPIGLDAKCSGAQICAILAGDERMMKATGFCSISDNHPDAYTLTMTYLEGFEGFERDDIKFPFMKKLYGGGIPAMLNDKDLMKHCPDNMESIKFAEIVLEGIERALGPRIMSLREHVYKAALAKCNKLNVEYFAWKHIDGHVVRDVVCNKIDVTEKYSHIRYDQYNARIEFGSDKTGKGITDISDRTPCREAFARKFVVSYIHGLDALIQRTVARICNERDIRGFVSIHDCFRVTPNDYFKLEGAIKEAYAEIFVTNDPLDHLFKQLDVNIHDEGFTQYITEERIMQEDNYFFC